MSVDFIATAVGVLEDDLDVPVYGARFPAGVEWPAIRVDNIWEEPAALPSNMWWESIIQASCYHKSDRLGNKLARDVRSSLVSMEGTTTADGVVVQAVKPVGISFVDDQGFTPPVTRWIVSVRCTARAAAGGS